MSIGLALRALWFRRGVSLALVAVATFVVAAAAAGPLYLRAAGESILQDRLRAAGLDAAGLEVVLVAPQSEQPRERLNVQVSRVLADRKGHGRPVSALELDVTVRGAAGVVVATRLTSRDGVCDELVLTGRCPAAPGRWPCRGARRSGSASRPAASWPPACRPR